MEQKPHGIRRWLTNLHFKKMLVFFLMVTSTTYSCTNKKIENELEIQQNPNKSIIGTALSSLYDSKFSKSGNDFVVAPKLKKYLNSDSDVFVQVGSQMLEKKDVRVTALRVADSKENSKITNEQDRYLFIESGKNFEIVDFIKVNKGKDYVANVVFENNSSGIAVGVFSESQEYFEIQELFDINSAGKKNKLNLNTVVIDCPVPTDYVSDEDSGNYKFGIKNGKKYSRFWKEASKGSDAKQSGNYILKQTTISSKDKNYKISVFEKNEKNVENAQHFDLKITVSEKSGNSYNDLKTNQNIVQSLDSSCAADGFTNVVSKDNYFTIEQTFCKDALYVSAYTTFKIVGTDIVLHKYSETYTDRNDPDKILKDKIWTTKEFGQIKFEDFNYRTSIKK